MTHSSPIGANMFVYCMNNPIACCDGDGDVAETIFDVVSLGISITEVAVNPADPWAWVGLAGDVLDLLPVVTGIGETARVIEVSVKATALSDDVITAARCLNKSDVAERFCRKVGSYEISYSDGKKYVGKGSLYRATVSAKEHLSDSNTVESILWRSSSNSNMAFLDEYARQLKYNFDNSKVKGDRNKILLNKIWSPGRKIANDLR